MMSDPDLETKGFGVLEIPEPPRVDQLARVTSAIATHVLGAARSQSRDPAEHQLDEHRARFGESDSKHISIQCDRCGLRSRGAGSVQLASARAREDGWHVDEHEDHCPACKDGAKLLGPGSNAGPVVLSGQEGLLVMRLTWLSHQISQGHTPRAIVSNAQRSGHRTMLSDLARAYAYDDDFLMEAVMKIETARPGTLPQFVDMGGDVTWLSDLFDILASEDVPEKER